MSAAGKPKHDRLAPGWDKWPARDHDQLPFVVPGCGDGRVFWAPRVTGDYGFDNTLGQQYARAALRQLRQPGGHQLLVYIVCDILKHGDIERDKGVLVGMFCEIGRAIEQPAAAIALMGEMAGA